MEDRLDAIFSIYIRLFYSDHAGYVSCFTCGHRCHWREIDCGHWKTRANHATRWEKNNCRPQCPDCNRVESGRQDIFEEELRDEIGDEEVERIERLSRTPVQWTDEQMSAEIKKYKALVDSMGKTQ